jgi:hypothetical protein
MAPSNANPKTCKPKGVSSWAPAPEVAVVPAGAPVLGAPGGETGPEPGGWAKLASKIATSAKFQVVVTVHIQEKCQVV